MSKYVKIMKYIILEKMTKKDICWNRTRHFAVKPKPQSVTPHSLLMTTVKNRSLYFLIKIIANVYFILFDTQKWQRAFFRSYLWRKKMSKYVRNMKIIILEKLTKMRLGGIEPGSSWCWLSPRALRHTEFSQQRPKNGPCIFWKCNSNQVHNAIISLFLKWKIN